LDGVFIGANKFKEMRNTMFGSFIAYLTVWWCLQDYGNIGLWSAILSFFGFRGLLMGWVYWRHHRKKSFFAFS
jgi:MATE family multidrug resistance protein